MMLSDVISLHTSLSSHRHSCQISESGLGLAHRSKRPSIYTNPNQSIQKDVFEFILLAPGSTSRLSSALLPPRRHTLLIVKDSQSAGCLIKRQYEGMVSEYFSHCGLTDICPYSSAGSCCPDRYIGHP